MTITCWNRCFLCATSVPNCRVKNSTSTSTLWRNAGHRPLFQYLLNDFKESSTLYQDILTLTFPHPHDDIESSSTVQFCNSCKQVSRSIRDLHLQLEVIQMKIIDTVKMVKQGVINNSRVHGTNVKVKEDLEALEKYVNSQEKQKFLPGATKAQIRNKRKLLELLHNFQTQVFEKGIPGKNYPFVYLERVAGITTSKDTITTTSTNIPAPAHTNNEMEATLIKEEPLDFPTGQEDMADQLSPIPDDLLESDYSSFSDIGDDSDWEDSDADLFKGMEQDKKIDSPELSTSSPLKGEKRKEEKKETSVLTRSRVTRNSSQKRKTIGSDEEKVEPKEEPAPSELTEAQKIAAKMKEERKRVAEEKRLKTRRMLAKMRRSKKPIEKKPRRKQYWCDECPFQSDRAPKLEQHLREHETAEKTFKCPDCNKEFSKKHYWDFHIYFYCGSTKWKCDICLKSVHGGKLKEHYENCHEGPVYSCDWCNFSFGTYQAYLNHTSDNHRHSEISFHCSFCPPEVSSRKGITKDILRHLYEVHKQSDNAFVCDYPDCSRVYYNETSLTVHKQTHEPVIHSCRTCGKVYAMKQDLENHILCVHKKEGPFICEICAEVLLSRRTLVSHKRYKHGVGRLTCELCPDKEYNSKVGLWKHKRVAHGIGVNDTLTCEKCGKVFISKESFQRHKNVHTEERNFTCEMCGFALKCMESLKKHKVNKHFGVRKHACNLCEKKFLLPSHLRVHMRSHTKEKPYPCEVCGQAFTQQATLDKHRKKRHNLYHRLKTSTSANSSSTSESASTSHSISKVSSTTAEVSEGQKTDVFTML